MKLKHTTKMICSVALGTVIAFASCAAQAQSLLPGVDIEKAITNLQDLDHPSITDVLNMPSLFKDSLDQVWLGNKTTIDQKITECIGLGNQQGIFPKGYTLYHQKSSVATSGTLQTQSISGSVLLLTYTVPHNYLETTTTVPGNSFGADLDPRFSFTYDLTFKISIPLSLTATGLHIASAVAEITNVSKPDSHNFSADVGVSIATIVKAFGGPDFLRQFQNALDGQQFLFTKQLQKYLDPVNTSLQQLAREGLTTLSVLQDIRKHVLVLRALVPENPVKVVVNRINDLVNVDPKYRNLIHTFARIRFFNAEVVGQIGGAASVFSRNIPADVRIVPIHIEIQRDVHIVISGSGASTTVEPQGVKAGVIRSIDLTYDRTTGRFTGPVSGSIGTEIGVLSDANYGVAFAITVDDNGPKPAANGFTTRPGNLKLNVLP